VKYTAKFFSDGFPKWKRMKDNILCRYTYRPLSFPISAFFANIGWTANMVSYFSALVVLVGCACYLVNAPIIGAIMFNVWYILDCVDGNIARSVKKEHYGDFADSMSSYLCVGLMFMCLGFNAYQTGGVLFDAGNPWIMLMGAFAGSSDSLMRLIYQKFLNSTTAQGLEVNRSEDPEQHSGINRIRMKVDDYMSIGGFLPLVLIFAGIFRFVDLVVVIWMFYYGLTFIASVCYLVMKTVKANKMEAQEDYKGVE